MAAVVEHGPKPAKPAAYTLLQLPTLHISHDIMMNEPDQYEANDPRNACDNATPADQHCQGLDGTSDRLSDNPFTKSKIGTKALKSLEPKLKAFVSRQGSVSSDAHDHYANIDSEVEVDPNLRRRKRRKISVEEQSTSRTETRDPQPASTKDDENNALCVSNPDLKGTNNDLRARAPDQSASTQSEGKRAENFSPKTTRGRKPRKKKLAIPSLNTTTANASKVELNILSETQNDQRNASSDQSLSLHSNGKLLSSPTTTSPMKKTKAVDDKKSISKRNLKMKNGRFIQTMEVVLKYGGDEASRQTTGAKIDAVLKTCDRLKCYNKGEISKTHPFFLGKVQPKLLDRQPESVRGDNTDTESESAPRQKEPVAWKDIKFTTHKFLGHKSLDFLRPAWPPLDVQHVGRLPPRSDHSLMVANDLRSAKLKSRDMILNRDEDILHIGIVNLRSKLKDPQTIRAPSQRQVSGAEVAHRLNSSTELSHMHDSILALHSALVSGTSAFDRGECAGPNMWSMQYSPMRCSEVLQPSTSKLHQWLQGLVIHNVMSGIDTNSTARRARNTTKRKKKKLKDELEGFVVDSEDEDEAGKSQKTAILITGPYGCGKTASVHAAARELGFDIFEIHPGMRRSAKDIFDKVGDMAHNHLVQKGRDLSRSSSLAPSDVDNSGEVDTSSNRRPKIRSSFLRPKSGGQTDKTDATPTPRSKREQKQSLILFEEVDLLFEDDKGFWNGVQSLIKHSKRPVVMTCNDLSSIPLDDLELFDILRYEPVDTYLATELLVYLTATEGHLVNRKALTKLYESKAKDLRACITELNFWCQMTVGSQQGGLDWMARGKDGIIQTDDKGRRLRTFSDGTFYESLDLIPQEDADLESAISYNQDVLNIPASDWCDLALSDRPSSFESCRTKLDSLAWLEDITDARSTLDLFDAVAGPLLATTATKLCQGRVSPCDRDAVSSLYRRKSPDDELRGKQIVMALEPIMVEKPTFPPSHGRLAPSVEILTSSVTTDIAPYVRSIVKFDKRLERQRDELHGSQGKARKTRAARAAAEGGDKANTRSERWFPKDLDFEKVIFSGGQWPEWYNCSADDTDMDSPASLSVVPDTAG